MWILWHFFLFAFFITMLKIVNVVLSINVIHINQSFVVFDLYAIIFSSFFFFFPFLCFLTVDNIGHERIQLDNTRKKERKKTEKTKTK